MKSHVTKLYDYMQADVPDALRRWRISEADIDRQLDMLSRSHAEETDAQTAQTGDSVVCRGEGAVRRFCKPVLLLYPGHGLCEKAIEDAPVGMKAGESKTVAASEGEVTLTVTRIIRRVPHPIDDELVRLEGIDGVQTVADYRRWYRENTEARNRKDRIAHIARMLLDAIAERSAYSVDPEEEETWARENANRAYDEMVSRGMDPTVPEDGTEFLTEAQAREKLFHQCRPFFRHQLACAAAAERLSGLDGETFFREELAREAQMYYKTTPEALLATAPEDVWRSQVYRNGSERLLREYAEKLLEA